MVRFAILIVIAAAFAGYAPPAAAERCDATGRLVLYTSQLEKDAKGLADAFGRHCRGVDLSWVRAPTSRLLDMLAIELTEGDPKADVIILADALHILPLKLDNRLMALPDLDVSALDPRLYDIDRTYFGTKQIAAVFVANTSGAVAPATWREFSEVAGDRVVAFPPVLSSIAATNFLLGLAQTQNLGWPYLERLAEAGVRPNSGLGQAVAYVAARDADIGVTVDFLAIAAREAGAPIDVTFPEDGTPVYTEPAAVMASTKNPTAATEFVEFLLSDAGQRIVSAQGFVPARKDIDLPTGFPSRGSIKPIVPNEEWALRNGAEIQARYRTLFQDQSLN